jgi:hypothetical protein
MDLTPPEYRIAVDYRLQIWPGNPAMRVACGIFAGLIWQHLPALLH